MMPEKTEGMTCRHEVKKTHWKTVHIVSQRRHEGFRNVVLGQDKVRVLVYEWVVCDTEHYSTPIV